MKIAEVTGVSPSSRSHPIRPRSTACISRKMPQPIGSSRNGTGRSGKRRCKSWPPLRASALHGQTRNIDLIMIPEHGHARLSLERGLGHAPPTFTDMDRNTTVVNSCSAA